MLCFLDIAAPSQASGVSGVVLVDSSSYPGEELPHMLGVDMIDIFMPSLFLSIFEKMSKWPCVILTRS